VVVFTRIGRGTSTIALKVISRNAPMYPSPPIAAMKSRSSRFHLPRGLAGGGRVQRCSFPSGVMSRKLTTCSPSFPHTGENRERQFPDSVPAAVACFVVTVLAATMPLRASALTMSSHVAPGPTTTVPSRPGSTVFQRSSETTRSSPMAWASNE
jgi:hypothetical protein